MLVTFLRRFVLVSSLALAAACTPANGPQNTSVGRGELYRTGKVPYDELFSSVHDLQVEVASVDDDWRAARSSLAQSVGLLPTAPPDRVLEMLRSRAGELKGKGATLSTTATTATADGKATSESRTIAQGLGACLLAERGIIDRMRNVPERADALLSVQTTLIGSVETEFPMIRAREVKRELEAARAVLGKLKEDAPRLGATSEKYVDDLRAATGGATTAGGAPTATPPVGKPKKPTGTAPPPSTGTPPSTPPPPPPTKPADDFNPLRSAIGDRRDDRGETASTRQRGDERGRHAERAQMLADVGDAERRRETAEARRVVAAVADERPPRARPRRIDAVHRRQVTQRARGFVGSIERQMHVHARRRRPHAFFARGGEQCADGFASEMPRFPHVDRDVGAAQRVVVGERGVGKRGEQTRRDREQARAARRTLVVRHRVDSHEAGALAPRGHGAIFGHCAVDRPRARDDLAPPERTPRRDHHRQPDLAKTMDRGERLDRQEAMIEHGVVEIDDETFEPPRLGGSERVERLHGRSTRAMTLFR